MKVVDFSADGVDVAIRLSKHIARDLHDEKLFEDSMLPVCAPRLVEQGLRSAADLARFPLIHYDFATSMHTPPVWADWFPLAGLKGADLTRGLRVNAADHALDAAVAGAGVVLSHKLIASDDVHSGRLVAPFGPELPLTSAYHFVCPKGHETRPNVRAFRDWLFAEMEETKERWAAIERPRQNTLSLMLRTGRITRRKANLKYWIMLLRVTILTLRTRVLHLKLRMKWMTKLRTHIELVLKAFRDQRNVGFVGARGH